MQRRELFSSLFSSKEKRDEVVLRPPYYEHSSSFFKECVICEAKSCSTFCQENIIKIASDGTPILDFSVGGCTYCDECAKGCDRGVLKLEYKASIKATIEIDVLKCMSWHQSMCFSCKDPCLDDAIEFLGMFRPTIDASKCTNCGFCISRCPTQAIVIRS